MFIRLKFGKQYYRIGMSTKLEHIRTKLWNYRQYLYSSNTARVSFRSVGTSLKSHRLNSDVTKIAHSMSDLHTFSTNERSAKKYIHFPTLFSSKSESLSAS